MRTPLLIALVLVSCGGEVVVAEPPASTPGPLPSSSVSPIPPPTPSPPAAVDLPEGLPATFGDDLDPADLPAERLVPRGASVSDVWFASTSLGETVIVAWADPGSDPLQRDGGLAAWRRFGEDPPWRAVFGRAIRAEEGVLGVRATTADVTGDGSDDAIVVLDLGGSGACGRYLVLDLATAGPVWERELCDARVDPSTAPVGLAIEQAVYRPGDAHCCPSAFRRTVLTYDGGRWSKASAEETAA